MNIEDSRAKTIYRNEINGKTLYSIGISHKKQDGTWENGFMNCRFPKDTDMPNKTKIMIISAWLDFYVKEKTTHPYIFINKYEIVNTEKVEEQLPVNATSEYDNEKSNVQLTDEDLPF